MSRKLEHLTILKTAIRQTHQCGAVHRDTVWVREVFGKDVVWQGDVEVFDLDGHAEAKKCFAWLHREGNGVRHITILKSRVVDSPQMAVRSAIFVDAQPVLPAPKVKRGE